MGVFRKQNVKSNLFIYKAKHEVNLMVSGGSGIWPEGTPCGTVYKAKRKDNSIYEAKRKVILKVSEVPEFCRKVLSVGGFIKQHVQ